MPRVIYSLMFTFEAPPPTIVQLIVPLNREGQSENGLAKAVPPKQRIICLCIGDWLRFRDKVRKTRRSRPTAMRGGRANGERRRRTVTSCARQIDGDADGTDERSGRARRR